MADLEIVSLNAPYSPVAIYYEDADTVEYIRKDVPCINRRVDGFLTLTLEMGNREPIGFRLKGFKNFYLHHVKERIEGDERDHFLKLVSAIERALSLLGKQVFEAEVREGYQQAYRIAEEDDPVLRELPDVA